ncbi:MAG: type IV secretory system conjugative DNA transfer family protein, partial [Pseudomonadota bacterium]
MTDETPAAQLAKSKDKARSMMQRHRRALLTFGIGAIPVIIAMIATYDRVYYDAYEVQLIQLVMAVIGSVIAFAIGFVTVFLLRRYSDVLIALGALALLAAVMIPTFGWGFAYTFYVIAAILGAIMALGKASLRLLSKPTTFGSAEWATLADVAAAGLTKGDGFFLGSFQMDEASSSKLTYGGDRHLLTVAPTRAGKGVSAIIPNLLTYEGSALVIDPKGENALTTAQQRYQMGQQVMLLDPWDLAASRLGTDPARFNPIDWLQPDDPDIAENAMLLADALVVSSGGKEQFWDEEAKALLVGLILHVAIASDEDGHRNLGRVRDLLMLDKERLTNLFGHMALSENSIVASTGARSLVKSEELLANVLATAQAQTHFLDSPRIRESLSTSDFAFDDLKYEKVTIFLILPADRLNTFGRWLRLMIQQAISVNARNIDHKPDKPVLFMLDEMPALG